MYCIAICLNKEFCDWSTELTREEYEVFPFQCPECNSIAVVYNSKTNIKDKEESYGFLLPLIVGEASDSEESME